MVVDGVDGGCVAGTWVSRQVAADKGVVLGSE